MRLAGDLVGVGGQVRATDVLDLSDVLGPSLEGRSQRADGFAHGGYLLWLMGVVMWSGWQSNDGE
jgi:hypothetical protein